MSRPDPRGPIRQTIAIEKTASVSLVTLSCGHVASLAPHFHYKIGSDQHCFECGQTQLAAFLNQSNP